MTDFILGATTGLCAWLLFFAGRWLYRWLHPWNAEVDARARAYLREPCKLWEENVEKSVTIPAYQRLSPFPTTVAPSATTEVIPIVLEIPPPADICLPSTTADELLPAVEDLVLARRSSFRVVDSPASTEET